MKRSIYLLLLVLCLGLGFYAGVVWAQNNAQLQTSAFSSVATGAEPLRSQNFQVRVSAGQLAPVGQAFSSHFYVHSGYLQAPSAPTIHSYYLPLFVKDQGE